MACTWYDNNKNIIKIICTQCNVLIIIHEAMSALLMDKKGSHKICLEVWPKGSVGYHWLRFGHFQQLSSGSKIKFFSYTNTWLGDQQTTLPKLMRIAICTSIDRFSEQSVILLVLIQKT